MRQTRILLVGTDAPLQRVLKLLLKLASLQCAAVYTDDRTSRSIETLCRNHHVPLGKLDQLANRTPDSCLQNAAVDWLVSVNSTVLYPSWVLRLARRGTLNMHPGRLPDYAGLHVHQWAIRNGETEFAATLHRMVDSIDAGAIVYEDRFRLTGQETGLGLFQRCLRSGTQLVERALRELDAGVELPSHDQDLTDRRVYRAAELGDGRIDWSRTAEEIERFVRAADYLPFPSPTYTPFIQVGEGKWNIRRVDIVEPERSTGTPGGFLSIDDEGVVIACGGDSALRATWIETRDGVRICHRELGVALSRKRRAA